MSIYNPDGTHRCEIPPWLNLSVLPKGASTIEVLVHQSLPVGGILYAEPEIQQTVNKLRFEVGQYPNGVKKFRLQTWDDVAAFDEYRQRMERW